MSQHYHQMRHSGTEAKRLLQERLAREEMGEMSYNMMVANHDDRTFKIVCAVLMVTFGAAVFIVTGLGY